MTKFGSTNIIQFNLFSRFFRCKQHTALSFVTVLFTFWTQYVRKEYLSPTGNMSCQERVFISDR